MQKFVIAIWFFLFGLSCRILKLSCLWSSNESLFCLLSGFIFLLNTQIIFEQFWKFLKFPIFSSFCGRQFKAK